MATVDDKKIIFSMVGVSKTIRQTNKQVLKNIYLSFFYGAKIGIIGLNGSGKSTLMKIIAGLDKDFQGEVVFSPGYSVGYLPQEPQLDPSKTVKEVVMEGVQPIVDALTEYEEINQKFGLPEYYEDEDKMNALFARQGELQDIIDATDAWNLDSKLERAMDALRCPPADQPVENLSGGERRRVALCRLLLQKPDVLLLDLAPGTGDMAISVAQALPNAELVVVTTPQPSASDIAVRSGLVALQVPMKVRGVVENMSYYEHKGEKLRIFGEGGGARVSEQLTHSLGYEVPLLAQLPLEPELRETGEAGRPAVLTKEGALRSDGIGETFKNLAESLMRLPQ